MAVKSASSPLLLGIPNVLHLALMCEPKIVEKLKNIRFLLNALTGVPIVLHWLSIHRAGKSA